MLKKVLVVAEDPAVSAVIDQLLLELHCRSSHVLSLNQAEQLASFTPYDLIICSDPFREGELDKLLKNSGQCPLIVNDCNTPLPSTQNLHRTIHAIKPDNISELQTIISAELQPNQKQITQTATHSDSEPLPGMIGNSATMSEVYRRIRKVAPTKSTVLIRGETGTGKELVASRFKAILVTHILRMQCYRPLCFSLANLYNSKRIMKKFESFLHNTRWR